MSSASRSRSSASSSRPWAARTSPSTIRTFERDIMSCIPTVSTADSAQRSASSTCPWARTISASVRCASTILPALLHGEQRAHRLADEPLGPRRGRRSARPRRLRAAARGRRRARRPSPRRASCARAERVGRPRRTARAGAGSSRGCGTPTPAAERLPACCGELGRARRASPRPCETSSRALCAAAISTSARLSRSARPAARAISSVSRV